MDPEFITLFTSSALFGIYLAIFPPAIYSFSLSKAMSTSRAQTRIQLIIVVTGIMLAFKVSINILHSAWLLCEPKDYVYRPFTIMDTFRSISVYLNILLPPIVALLSDGILGWRVYVVWNRRPWLRYMLIMGLGSNFVIGITAAALIVAIYVNLHSTLAFDWVSIARLYKVWVWMAFALNSCMTASILWRIRSLGNLCEKGLGRYTVVLRALIEAAVISWAATFTSAVLWSSPSACTFKSGRQLHRADCMQNAIMAIDGNVGGIISTTILTVIPTLLGISQVLIVTRVNLSKFVTTQDLAKMMTVVTQEWEDPATAAGYNVVLGHLRVCCERCGNCCGCRP